LQRYHKFIGICIYLFDKESITLISLCFLVKNLIYVVFICKFATDNPIRSPKGQMLAMAEIRKGWEEMLKRSVLVGESYMIRRLLDALALTL